MNKNEHVDQPVIELGEASQVTRGQAIIELDVNGGQLRFGLGIVED